MGHHTLSDSNLRTMAKFFPAQGARVESCLRIVAAQTSAGVHILNSGVSDLLGTHLLIKSVFFLLTLKNPWHFESFLKLWLRSVMLFCNICGARTQAAAFSPTLSRGDHSLLTVWPPQGYTHTGQPSQFHLVNPQELFWVWPAFNPLFLPVQAQPLYSPGTLSSKETFEKHRLPIGQKSAPISAQSAARRC